MLTINLKYRRKDFEEIYFKNNSGSYIKNSASKEIFSFLVKITIVVMISFLYSIIKNEFWPLFALLFIVFFITLIQFVLAANIIRKWKNRVSNYLDELDKRNNYRIEVSTKGFRLLYGDKIVIEDWSNFKVIEIDNESIYMIGKEGYLFPAKSMTIEEFEQFKEILNEIKR